MSDLPITATLTDIFGKVWRFNADGLCRIKEIDGLDGAPWKFDETAGVAQPGVTVHGRNDEANTITASIYIDHPDAGLAGRNLLAQWRKGNGRGWPRNPGGPLMKFEVADTRRFQMVRLMSFKKAAEYQKIFDCGRAFDEVEWRSDESWWRTKPIVKTFTAAQFPDAEVANKGDEASWPHYRLEGPIVDPKIGLDGELIALPTLTAGQWLEIESDPDWWEIRDQAGVDRSWIGNRWHTKAPAGNKKIPVTITGTGTTTATKLTVTVPQLFWSAL